MTMHANSQLTVEETVRLQTLALNDLACRGSLHLERASAVGRSEMLGMSSLITPEGPVYRVALTRVVDGETLWDETYRDEADAVAVWEHLAAEAGSADL